MQSCRVLGDPPDERGAAGTGHFAAQPRLPECSCPGWGSVRGIPRRSQGQPRGGSQLRRSRSPCLDRGCSRAIKGSVGRVLAWGGCWRWARGFGAAARPGDLPLGIGAVGLPHGGDALAPGPQPVAALQNSLCPAGPGKGPGSPCPCGQAPTPTPIGAQGAGERVQLVLHGHGQSCSRAQLVTQPREGALT